jgi:AcrR family transcriptional regulator
MSKKEPTSRNAPYESKKKDARVRRTHERLGMALMELIRDCPIDSVTVQDVLDRASVGRSTFYLHFRDKNDLLLSQLEMFLEFMSTTLSTKKESSRRLAPVREMFEHIGEQKKIYRALADADRLHDFFDLAQGYFARGIEQRLKETNYDANSSRHERLVVAVGLAGSLLSLFRWWMDAGTKLSPTTMDEMFHQIAWGKTFPSPLAGAIRSGTQKTQTSF